MRAPVGQVANLVARPFPVNIFSAFCANFKKILALLKKSSQRQREIGARSVVAVISQMLYVLFTA